MRKFFLPIPILALLPPSFASQECQERVPIELPTDPAIRVYIGFRGWWRNLHTVRERLAELRAQVSVFQPGEEVEEGEADRRAFVQAQGFEEEGWEEIVPAEDKLGMFVLILDEKGRLGKAVVKGLYAPEPEGEIEAEPEGGRIEGSVEVGASWLYYTVQVFDKGGRPLFTLCAKSSSVEQWSVYPEISSFKPYTLKLEECPYPWEERVEEKEIGDPYEPRDPKEAPGLYSDGYMTKCFRNDNAEPGFVDPPRCFYKRKVIKNTLNWKVLAKATGQWVPMIISEFLKEDRTPVPESVKVPTFSEGCVAWHLEFCGEHMAVVGLPLYKERKEVSWLEILKSFAVTLGRIKGKEFPGGLKAEDWAAILNEVLTLSKEARQETGLKPGDIKPIGDVWAITVFQRAAEAFGLQNLTQEVTIKVSGPCGMKGGQVKIIRCEGVTKPEPPYMPPPEPVYPSSEYHWSEEGGVVVQLDNEGVARVKLGKGWKWRIKAIPPPGYGPAEAKIEVPPCTSLSLTCPLEALLNLYVYTYSGNELVPAKVMLYRQEKGE